MPPIWFAFEGRDAGGETGDDFSDPRVWAIRNAWYDYSKCSQTTGCFTSPHLSTSSVLFVPNTGDTVLYQRFQQSPSLQAVVVYSDDYGAVALAPSVFEAWLALEPRTAADGTSLFSYIGLPKRDGTFERGVITNNLHAVVGDIYAKWLARKDDLGLPLGEEEITPKSGRVQRFQNGEIYWGPTLGAFMLNYGAILDHYKAQGGPGGALGFPTADEAPMSATPGHPDSALSARFEGGALYYHSSFGVRFMPSSLVKDYEDRYGGPLGGLGFPVADPGIVVSTGDQYVDLSNGILIKRGSIVHAFSDFDFYFDRMQGRDDDCVLGICGGGEMQPKIRIETPSGFVVDETLPFQGGTWDPVFQRPFSLGNILPLSQWWAKVTVEVKEIDDTSGRDDMGSVSDYYTIENLWGLGSDHSTEHRNDKLSVWFTLRNGLPFGDKPFRQEQWWAYRNFSTDELSYEQFAQTFVDVHASDEWYTDPINNRFYHWVYKGLAKNGNCFGMTAESLYSTVGRSPYAQPISQYLPELARDAARPTRLPITPAQQAMMDHINVKMGYQLGAKSVAWMLGTFASGLTHDPALNFHLSFIHNASGDYPLISIADYFFGRAHSVRPYAWEAHSECDSAACLRIKVADPNYPWGEHQGEDLIEIEQNRLGFSSYSYRDYSGGNVLGGRLFFQPFHVMSQQPYTPFGVIGQAIDQLTSFLVGSGAKAAQITDELDRTLFRTGLTELPASWADLQTDDDRLPDMMPFPISDAGPGEPEVQLFVSRARGSTHHYEVTSVPGAPLGQPYEAVFTSAKLSAAFEIPGTPGHPERITARQINERHPAVALRIPDASNKKKVKWLIAGAQRDRWAELRDLEMSPGQELTVRLEQGGYRVVIDNDGPTTRANLRIHHGGNKGVVEAGELLIPSGGTVTQFGLPETTLTVANEVPGQNGWLIAPVTVSLSAKDYSTKGIADIRWSSNELNWSSHSGTPVSFTYSEQGKSTLWYFAAVRRNWGQGEIAARGV